MSRTGETFIDIRGASAHILADLPEFVFIHARRSSDGGPPLHAHKVHADGFAILDGELQVPLGHDGERALGQGIVWVAPPGVAHAYRHDGANETRFLNFHAPGMGFADYLFGGRTAEEADQYDPPSDGGRPSSEASVRRFAEEGEVITDKPERTIRILADYPELCVTWTRYSQGEEGPGPHIHKEHVDAFFILTGELNFGLGPEVERIAAPAGTFILAPQYVIHTFRNDGPSDATWLNFHAPSKGFASFLRDPDFVWDSFDAPADGGRPLSDAIVQRTAG
jgi:mannose-6-phosphate isomerase-like protein (cupin superfamily)